MSLALCVSLASCSTEYSSFHCSQLSLKLLGSKYFCGPSRSALSGCKTPRNVERESFLWMDQKEVVCCQLAQDLFSKYEVFFRRRDVLRNYYPWVGGMSNTDWRGNCSVVHVLFILQAVMFLYC